jgi:hypothetical protein
MSSRSPLPLWIGALATTLSLNVGRMVIAPATNAASEIAEIDPKIFFMTRPCRLAASHGLSPISRIGRPFGSVMASTILRFEVAAFALESLGF